MAPRLRLLAHLDDVGVTAGSVRAWRELRAAGVVRSASVMVPCPWYRAAVDDHAADPGQDLGVHVTLTSEWPQYRWRPLATGRGGLCDDQGFFHRRPEAVLAHADPAAVEDEIEAQVARALADGIRPSHLDAHMGTAFLPGLIQRLHVVAARHGLAVPVFRDPRPLFDIVRLPGLDLGYWREVLEEAGRRGDPVFDRFVIGFAPEGVAMADHLTALLGDLPDGRHWLALHANAPGDMAAIAPHMVWPREAEHAFLAGPEAAAVLRRLSAVTEDLTSLQEAPACAS